MLQRRKPILISQNTGREGAGRITVSLERSFSTHETIHFGSAGKEKLDTSRYSGVIVLGGPQSANDENDVMRRELDFVRRVVEADVPYLGICLGMQVLVKATGGSVRPNHVKEIGFRNSSSDEFFLVRLTEEGRESALFRGFTQQTFPVFQLHGETVEPATGQKLLATGSDCHVQVIQVGETAFGVQFHPELDANIFERWKTEDPDLSAIDKPALESDYRSLNAALSFHGRRMIENFLDIVQLKSY